jgi:hypothetical protein
MSEAATAAAIPAPRAGSGLPATPYIGSGGISVTDLIVIFGGIALLVAGWALQRAHDSRLATAEVAGVELAYPERWLPLPALPPAVAQWTDHRGSGATLTFYAEPAPTELGAATLGSSPNPAIGQPAYTPLRSDPVTFGEIPAVRSDYAYARAQVARSALPEIVRGREVSWTAGDQRYALVMEAPERDWARVAPLFESLATAAVTAAGVPT